MTEAPVEPRLVNLSQLPEVEPAFAAAAAAANQEGVPTLVNLSQLSTVEPAFAAVSRAFRCGLESCTHEIRPQLEEPLRSQGDTESLTFEVAVEAYKMLYPAEQNKSVLHLLRVLRDLILLQVCIGRGPWCRETLSNTMERVLRTSFAANKTLRSQFMLGFKKCH